MPVLAIDAEKLKKIKTGSIKTVVGNRLQRNITMETGAHHSVMPRQMAGTRKVRPSPGSRRGMCYVAAGNERIKNEGEITFEFESLEGHRESFVFQIAEVNKALGFGAYMVYHGFRLVYDKDMDTNEDLSYVIHKPTNERSDSGGRRMFGYWMLSSPLSSFSGISAGRRECELSTIHKTRP